MYGYGNSLFLATHSILARGASGGGVSDADAQAFITAAAITDPTQQTAINTLVVDLKGYSIWTKMKALYPIVGSTASQQKYNLKDPRDLDAAFRLVFSGGWTHSSTGALPNGTNAYADTKLTPSTILSLNNSHLSFYSLSNTFAGKRLSIGSVNGLSSQHSISLKSTSNNANFSIDQGDASFVNNNSTGFYIASRTANNSLKAYKNNSLVATDPIDITPLSNPFSIYIGATNISNTPNFYDFKKCAFASIGDGLTDAEALNFYTAVQAFQTTLGRQV